MRGEDFIPLVAIPAMFITIAFIVYQTLQHRLRMKMVEKGVTNLDLTKMNPPADNSLKYGLVSIALGVAIFMGLAFERFVPDLGGEFGIAFIPIFIGAALIISALIERKRGKRDSAPA